MKGRHMAMACGCTWLKVCSCPAKPCCACVQADTKSSCECTPADNNTIHMLEAICRQCAIAMILTFAAKMPRSPPASPRSSAEPPPHVSPVTPCLHAQAPSSVSAVSTASPGHTAALHFPCVLPCVPHGDVALAACTLHGRHACAWSPAATLCAVRVVLLWCGSLC